MGLSSSFLPRFSTCSKVRPCLPRTRTADGVTTRVPAGNPILGVNAMTPSAREELERKYEQLQAAWRLGISFHRPDWDSLLQLQERISTLEQLLGQEAPR